MSNQCLRLWDRKHFVNVKMYQFAQNLHVRQLRSSLYDIVIKFRFILFTLGNYMYM